MSLTSAQKFLWVLAGVAALAFVWLLLWSDYRADSARTDAEPPFFAEFELTDHRGMVQTEEDFAGRWMLVFFGFTNCPDVCPTTLGELSVLLDDLGPQGDDLQVLLISGDPERDTPERLNEYLQSFDPRIVGLTGSEEEVEEAFSAFKAYRAIVPLENGDYTVDHSAGVYLFDREGGFFGTLDTHESNEVRLQKIERLLAI